jgi:isopenicillin N synthase-like dioxygenase
LHRYPDISQAIAKDQCSIAPHTDHGFITFLAQDNVGGLQVQCPATGNWLAMPYRPNTFIMNAGDMLQRLTNGTYRSAVHRVMNNSGKNRYSIPLFFEPNLHQQIDVLPQFAQDQLPHYPSVIYGDYLSSRLKPNYKALQT